MYCDPAIWDGPSPRQEGVAPAPSGDGIVEMREAEGESFPRARRVKVDTGDLTGREADVIVGEPVVTPLFGRGRQPSSPGSLMCGAALVTPERPVIGRARPRSELTRRHRVEFASRRRSAWKSRHHDMQQIRIKNKNGK